MPSKAVIVRQPGGTRHDPSRLIPGHPEVPVRLRRIEERLEEEGWLGQEVVACGPGSRELAELVHPKGYLDSLAQKAAAGGAVLDPDTALGPDSCAAAVEAAGAAAQLVDLLTDGARSRGFALLRPPGHHAERGRAMGFCLINNAAVAAAYARSSKAIPRVAIVDWDVHHGNGTEAIFAADPTVLYISLHRYPFYPGTGAASDAGSGAGYGYTLNLPLPAGSDGRLWRAALEGLAVPALRRFAPQLIVISAGFDAHRLDPLGGCRLEAADYAELARAISTVGEELAAPVGALLEGGYHPDALTDSVLATITGLTDGRRPQPAPSHPLVEELRRVVGSRPLLKAA